MTKEEFKKASGYALIEPQMQPGFSDGKYFLLPNGEPGEVVQWYRNGAGHDVYFIHTQGRQAHAVFNAKGMLVEGHIRTDINKPRNWHKPLSAEALTFFRNVLLKAAGQVPVPPAGAMPRPVCNTP